jgi:hypothetical protein
LVENSRDLSEMSAWIEVGPARSMPQLPPKTGVDLVSTPGRSNEMSATRTGSNVERRFVATPLGRIHVATVGTGFPVLLLHQTPRSWDE